MPAIAPPGRLAFGDRLALPLVIGANRAFLTVGQVPARPSLVGSVVGAFTKPEELQALEHFLCQAKA
jgi:hypothetical protein